jgi:hypothetical protein
MALTQENKYKVIFALCHVGTIIDPTSVNFNSIIRDRLNIDNQFVEDQVISLLAKIELIKSKLESSPTKNNVKKIGDIELDTDVGIVLIKKEYNRLLGELSNLLDIPCACKIGSTRNVSICL